jgi:branched-chain amino acid transport system substrate-binding protein
MENTSNGVIKKVIGILVLIVITFLIILGMSKDSRPVISEAVKVGVIIPLSGGAADYGQSTKKGIDLAVAKARRDYGVDLNVIYEDSQADPKLAVSAIQKLINIDGVKYVIGFTSGEVLSMCPISETNNVVLLSPASSPVITQKCGDYTFRNLPSDIYQGIGLADKVFTEGYKRVAIFYINNDYGVGLKDEFVKNYQGVVTGVEAHKLGDTDFRTQLIKIKASKPDAIILITHMAEGSIILQQRVDLGLTQPIFASETLKDPTLFKIDKILLKNLFISSVAKYEGGEFQDFNNLFKQKYNSDFGAYSDYEYDNVLTLASAIAKCKGGNDSKCVKDEIYKTDITGATGRINFDANGDRVNKDYTLYKVEDGDFLPAK